MGTGVDREWEAAFGLTAPPCFALAAQRHIAEYGTTEEQLAMVGLENHTHASKNPNAHFPEGRDARIRSWARGMISTPLRPSCARRITDGAAAVLLASEDRARDLTDQTVWIRGTGQAARRIQLNLRSRGLRPGGPGARAPAAERVRMAGIATPTWTSRRSTTASRCAELIAYEELGFCGRARRAVRRGPGRSDYGATWWWNPRGGLIGCGHPAAPTASPGRGSCFAQSCSASWRASGPRRQVGLSTTTAAWRARGPMIYGARRRDGAP